MWVPSLNSEDDLEEAMATHSSILAWRIPWTEEHGRLQSIVLQRVMHDWNDFACKHTWPGICQCFPRISRIGMGVEVVIFSNPLPESLILWIPSFHSSISAPTLGPRVCMVLTPTILQSPTLMGLLCEWTWENFDDISRVDCEIQLCYRKGNNFQLNARHNSSINAVALTYSVVTLYKLTYSGFIM